MRKTRVIAAVLCAGMLLPGVAMAAPAPTAVEHRSEGHLVSAEVIDRLPRQEVVDYLAGYELDTSAVRNGVDLYLLTYRTVGVDGRPTTASALTVLPNGRDHTFRAVAWLHGTRVFRGDTGSVSDNLDRAAAVLFAGSGFATVAPDYLGLGTGPGHHPYMLSEPTVTATTDALRASRSLAARTGRKLDGRVLVSGFSQGGQASMIVGRALQRSREFDLGAIAGIAGPYDIRGQEMPAALDGRLDGISATMYLGYAITAWNRVHPIYDSPSEAFRAPYDQVVESMFDSDHQEGEVVATLPHTPEELFTNEFLARLAHPDGGLAEVLAANDDPCEWRPSVPVRLYAGTADRDVVSDNATSCLEDLGAHNTRDSRVVNVGAVDHFTSARVALPQVLTWFNRL
ncbi:alpha/beta hydrolase [Actinophytocola oryzae]|uniref:Secretory lipase n=1 Tax=Actinophytocola oryzae TaxID=502181 RepID=A0A4R7VWU1_9PSEU|nr:lipase family protein [Actinophytocola oryzae]TDV54115.1 secretory lipase [Actinophytocola oryzae]